MIPRPLILTGMLGAAVAGPIMLNQPAGDSAGGGWQLPWATGDTAATSTQPATTTLPTIAPPQPTELQHNGSLIYRSPAPLEGSVVSISDALRMDVSRQWVYSRWARKSTGLGDPELFGVRAPLVTGRQMTDLAGAISYYFDANGVMQKLRFHGRTADTTQLIALAQQRFGLQRQQGVPGEQLYQRRTRAGVESQLRTRPASVMWGTSPHSSFVVDLEVNRPGSGRSITPPTPQLALPEPVAAAPAASASRPGASRPVSQSAPAPVETAAAETVAEQSAGDDGRTILGLTPGRLPRSRWPH